MSPGVGVLRDGPGAGAGAAGTASGERTHPATPLVRVWLVVVAFSWFFATEFLNGGLSSFDELLQRVRGQFVLLALGAGLMLSLAAGWWSWWTTRFHVTDDELRIENAGAFTESKRIAFSRIQSVDINQPFAARLLGLAELVIDVGGGGTATRLSYLTRRRAGELRDHLLARAQGVRHPDVTPHVASRAWDDLSTGDRVLVRLHPGEIILAALLSLELLSLVAGFAIPVVLGISLDMPLLAVGGGLVPLALAIWGYLARRVIGQFNYTLAQTPTGLRITRGLTALSSQTVPAHRVQAIQVAQPLLWRLIGRYRVDVTVLGTVGVDASGEVNTATLLLPVGTAAQVGTALDAVWPGLRLGEIAFTGSPRRARWLEPFAGGWNGYGFDASVLVARQGWFTRREFIVPHARLQSIALVQGPLDRATGTASVALHTSNPLGGGRIVHADAAGARRLVLEEMTRARAARTDDLLRRPTA